MGQNRIERWIRRWKGELSLKRAVLVIVFLLNTRTFEFFPAGRPVEEGWFGLCLFALLVLLPLFKIRANWRFSYLELYLLTTMAVLLLLPATSAVRVFGQPLVYGILAKRSMLLLGTWVLLGNAYRRRLISEQDLEKSLLCAMWFVAILYAGMRLFLNPASFPSAPIGFILGFGSEQTFSVPGYLLPFGSLYYILRGLRQGRLGSYALGLLIFLVSTGGSWRALTLTLSLTIILLLFAWKPLGSAILLLIRVLLVLAAGLVIFRLARPREFTSATAHLGEALKVAAGNGPGRDPSANARIEESDTALPYVRAHPWLGSGLLSVQWHGGTIGVLGVFFSDTDIGLLGMLFTYGIIGVVICSGQYWFAIQGVLRSRHKQTSAFQDGVFGYVLFSFLFSLSTGMFVVYIESTSLFCLLALELSRRSLAVTQSVAPGSAEESVPAFA